MRPCTVFNSKDGNTVFVPYVTSIVHGVRSGLVASTIPTRRHSESRQLPTGQQQGDLKEVKL
jgi:hypothetical protein